MGDAEIGQLSSGYGLSGEQLVRYQKQRSEVIRKQMEKKVCTADQEKAKTDWRRIGEGALGLDASLMNPANTANQIKPVQNLTERAKAGTDVDDIPQIIKNAAQGKAYEEQEFSKFADSVNDAVGQITIKTTEGTKMRVDAIGIDKNTGNIVINEFKSSQTAPLTSNQKIGFPQLEMTGGIVVGKGKGAFTGGVGIPSGIKVEIIRPSN